MVEILKWVVTVIIVAFCWCVLQGSAIALTWNWFVCPVTGVRAITFQQGIGISIFLTTVGPSITATIAEKLIKAEPTPSRLGLISRAILTPLAGIAWGWAWYSFFIV